MTEDEIKAKKEKIGHIKDIYQEFGLYALVTVWGVCISIFFIVLTITFVHMVIVKWDVIPCSSEKTDFRQGMKALSD
jgi:hypothetical protein